MKFVGKSDKGISRTVNQDYFYLSNEPIGKIDSFAILADGMGGTKGGEVASQNAVDTFIETIKEINTQLTIEEQLKLAVKYANNKVFKLSREDEALRRMGTTLVIALYHNNHLCIGNVGDSRLYLIRNSRIYKITKDHSLVEQLLDEGMITLEEAMFHPDKNVITRALGVEEELAVDLYSSDLERSDKILLCSDGLTNVVTEEDILSIILNHSDEDAVDKLIEAANNNGGPDNITVILGSYDNIDLQNER